MKVENQEGARDRKGHFHDRKDVAALKGGRTGRGARCDCNFHDRKDVAALKAGLDEPVQPGVAYFHDRKDVAALKDTWRAYVYSHH